MLNVYLPGRPATPQTATHLNDSSVLNSRLAAAATPQGSCDLRLHRSDDIAIDCSRVVHSLSSNNHHLAAAGHTEWPRLRKQEQPLPQSLGSASSKGNSKSPKRQFASDLGVEEQQKGYAESLHSKTPGRWLDADVSANVRRCTSQRAQAVLRADWRIHQRLAYCQRHL